MSDEFKTGVLGFRETCEEWKRLGTGYPGEGAVARAAFDVLAPVRYDGTSRSAAFEMPKETTPTVMEVWEMCVEIGALHDKQGCERSYRNGYAAAVDASVKLVEYEGALTPDLRTKFQRLSDFGGS